MQLNNFVMKCEGCLYFYEAPRLGGIVCECPLFTKEKSKKFLKKSGRDCPNFLPTMLYSHPGFEFHQTSGIKKIDLINSLWAVGRICWDKFAPEIYEQMENAYHGKIKSLVVCTVPTEQAKFGKVVVGKNKASVSFYSLWNSLLRNHIIVQKKDIDKLLVWFNNKHGFCRGNPVGAKVEGMFYPPSFEGLQIQIKNLEAVLEQKEREHASQFARYVNKVNK